MATKVMNLRMTQTKQSLIHAFFNLVSKKDFEKITIADITKGAQVNRATFYAHFNDKYDLMDYILGDSASASIENHTAGVVSFNQDSITQLVLAVCDFYHQPNIQCRSSYVGLVLPQMKEKILKELKVFLSKSLEQICTDNEKNMFVPVFAQVIHEGALQWATGNITTNKEEVAKKVALFVMSGSQSFEGTLR
ncbi:TetR/AcrR family transcriptional regulator [Paenibacillus contaminans]|uniref:TetR/AcrR family transcriptional regulator n=1 Tax=Paenibacillus contaminans TaxID=450362 RepID=A0A329MNZ5_9BACL|nr:TetR/AcrR family transcriptional regulator [Paenibacillus contaminans]RAV21474.1 TetR/AcrR family transcriptional regulator [Paenibacillus contaminans]